jgi:hypothetical protein
MMPPTGQQMAEMGMGRADYEEWQRERLQWRREQLDARNFSRTKKKNRLTTKRRSSSVKL